MNVVLFQRVTDDSLSQPSSRFRIDDVSVADEILHISYGSLHIIWCGILINGMSEYCVEDVGYSSDAQKSIVQ